MGSNGEEVVSETVRISDTIRKPLVEIALPLLNSIISCDELISEEKISCHVKDYNHNIVGKFEVIPTSGTVANLFQNNYLETQDRFGKKTSQVPLSSNVTTTTIYIKDVNDDGTCDDGYSSQITPTGSFECVRFISTSTSTSNNPAVSIGDNTAARIVLPQSSPIVCDPGYTAILDEAGVTRCAIMGPFGSLYTRSNTFTNVFEFKSKKERKIENFSQNLKCKARY
jgi:hypothetical protein